MAYRIVDAAVGQLEAGSVALKPMLERQAWDDTPVPVTVTSGTTAPGAQLDPSLSVTERARP
jgi:hypothetical protein